MNQQNLALHETMEIHELINLKKACLMNSKMIQGLVFDQELKALLEKDVNQSITAMNALQGSDYQETDRADGMPGLVDSTIALEFLLSIKTGIRTSAIAMTEIENSKARAAIRDMLNDMISLHAETTDLMITKGWLHPFEAFRHS